jgi:hypothetical protein
LGIGVVVSHFIAHPPERLKIKEEVSSFYTPFLGKFLNRKLSGYTDTSSDTFDSFRTADGKFKLRATISSS